MKLIGNPLIPLLLVMTACLTSLGLAQPVVTASRIIHTSKTGSNWDEALWSSCEIASGFKTYKPFHGRTTAFPTEVRIAYDDRGLFIFAKLHDPHPDSILRQLGSRDDELNADYFGVAFDTYQNQGDAYYFQVTASGVQSDYRRSDKTYDAVWWSAVDLTESGWNARLFIPYAALRFPAGSSQVWGLQLYRYVRRIRELSQWALEEKGSANELVYWGTLQGMQDVNAPLRLSFTPFAALVQDYQPVAGQQKRSVHTTVNGGLDMKLGLSEAFTLDVTLLPDFSQVRSDDYVKNLSAYETVYDENRSFFNEGVDLFKRGDLFYSRRIGREPRGRQAAWYALDSGGTMLENPDRVKLINAVKVSGRNKHGLALGFFNAITGAADAVLSDSTGITRTISTEPLANYNITVLDQQFQGNTALYLINTNVLRPNTHENANVTASGLTLANPSNRYELRVSGALSQIKDTNPEASATDPGFRYTAAVAKVKGTLQFLLSHGRISKNFDINDMGVIHRTGLEENLAWLSYRQYEPFGPFLEMRNTLQLSQSVNLSDRSSENLNMNYSAYTELRNYLSLWWGGNLSPIDRHDYYESRTQGQVFVRPGYINGYLNFSSDYRKPLAIDGGSYAAKDFDTYRELWFWLKPIVRLSDRLSFYLDMKYEKHEGVKGYVKKVDASNIIFGERQMNTFTNAINATYMFKADFALSLWLRHYWQEGWYTAFFELEQDGLLKPSTYAAPHDYSFNALNLDLSCSWVFAPGSLISIVWKQGLLEENHDLVGDYLENLKYILARPQASLWSVKFVYYLDYANLFHTKQSS